MGKQPPSPFFTLRGHEGEISALHFTNEIELYGYQPVLISGSEIGEIFIWNLRTFRTEHRFRGHENEPIMFLDYYNSSLLSQGKDGFINIWKYFEQGGREWAISDKIPSNSMSVGFCSSVLFLIENTALLMYLNEDEHLLQIRKFEDEDFFEDLHFNTEFGMCFCIKAFRINGNIFVLAGFENGCIGLWDIESKDEICHLKLQEEPVICMDFDSEHRCMGMSGSVNQFLEAWKVTEDMDIVKVKTVEITNLEQDGVTAIKIRHDGKIVITAGHDSVVRIFSWKTLKLLAVLMFHDLPVQCLACCPVTIPQVIGEYKSVFASGSQDQNICLWNIY